MAKFNIEDFPSLAGEATPKDVPDIYVPPYVELTSKSLNLQDQLLLQYNTASRLLHEAAYDRDTPLSQKASALNSATSILGALTKMQAELYSLERIKAIEGCLISVLKEFPDVQAAFLARYEEALSELSE
jgi:hypothetical protein